MFLSSGAQTYLTVKNYGNAQSQQMRNNNNSSASRTCSDCQKCKRQTKRQLHTNRVCSSKQLDLQLEVLRDRVQHLNRSYINLGGCFPLLRNGLCNYYTSHNGNNFKFTWTVNPYEGVIEVDLHPKERIAENHFVIEFLHPLREIEPVRIEWNLYKPLRISFSDIGELYNNEDVVCQIYMQCIPHAHIVRPLEDRITSTFLGFFGL